MKYRIVLKNNGYYIQRKWLGMIWINLAVTSYYHSDLYGIWERRSQKTIFQYNSLDSAKKDLELRKKFPIWHNGHKIDYWKESWRGRTGYIDLSSGTWITGYSYATDRDNLEDFLNMLDRIDQRIKIEKQSNKIIKIWE